jgi:muramidase (phage lysozyme)
LTSYKGTDDCTDTILDFIAGGVPGNPSGETQGNYNAYFGHVHGSVELSKYTLDDIYEFQAAMLAKDPRSSAVGRYQFLKKTLQALQEKLGLPGTTLFTHELQDKLALALMVGRGYKRWWNGEMSDSELATGLSCEWASLPDPAKGGRSHYAGDGLNSNSTATANVLAMLQHARDAWYRMDAAKQVQPAPAPAAPNVVRDALPVEVEHTLPHPSHFEEVLAWVKRQVT